MAIFGSTVFLLFLVTFAVVISMGGLLLVRKKVDHQTLTTHHDVAGSLLAIVGTLYAVVLGLIVVGSLNKFEAARQTVEKEASALHDIFHLASGLTGTAGSKLRSDCMTYAQRVIDTEWSTMLQGMRSREAHEAMMAIETDIINLKAETNAQSNLQSALLSELDELGDNRHDRILVAQPEFDGIIWAVMIIGGSVLVVFTYFFGIENIRVQMIMTGMVTLVLSLNLMIVAMFNYPYSGDVRIPPTAFILDVKHFQEEMPIH